MATLPTGTVTLLFTDIVGFVRLIHRLGEQAAALLANHDAILTAAVAAHGGAVVEQYGDACCVAFSGALAAVVAAAEAQCALARHAWPAGEAAPVRMGLHTGEPLLAGARYIGPAVYQAARISQAAHGGQVLLSADTAALVRDRLPGGLVLRDLGAHRLQDFAIPVGLCQLVIPSPPQPPPPAVLTAGEVAVLRLVAQGLTDTEVAARLARSPRTVHHHLRAIYAKLGVSTRSAATRFAIEHHLA